MVDAARAISGFVDGIIARVERHETLERLAAGATVPVINALSDRAHPCEALSDLHFLVSRFDDLGGLRATWMGDCTNVAHSFAAIAVLAGIDLTVACPPQIVAKRSLQLSSMANDQSCGHKHKADSRCNKQYYTTFYHIDFRRHRVL